MNISWDESMRTGQPDIDAQHRELIRRLDSLNQAMLQGTGHDKIDETMQFAGEYAKWHFGFEEECMHRFRCPVAALNKEAHAHFKSTFSALAGRLQTEGPTESLQLAVQRELLDWFLQHIQGIDTQLRPYVKAAETGAAGEG